MSVKCFSKMRMTDRAAKKTYRSDFLYISNRLLFVAVIAVFFLIISISCASGRKSSYRSGGVYHIVKPGQNLYRIALTYGVPLNHVARINRISDPSQIESGQRIFIPGATKTLEVPIMEAAVPAYAMLPAAGTITSLFGDRRSGHHHTGIDIAAPRGSPVKAVLPGRVIFSGVINDYGRTVKISHENGLITLYAHIGKIHVRKGQLVDKGQTIATVGNSGRTNGYHLHFEVRRRNVCIDPLTLLRR